MLKRIPHSTQDISGEPKTKEYVQHHQKYARLQFKAFIGELAQQYVLRQLIVENDIRGQTMEYLSKAWGVPIRGTVYGITGRAGDLHGDLLKCAIFNKYRLVQ